MIAFYLKNDALHDAIAIAEHIAAFDWTTPEEVEEITALTLLKNAELKVLFGAAGITLVDFRVEFGRVHEGEGSIIILADEISLASCRLWGSLTKEKLDKDRFRRDLGRKTRRYGQPWNADAP